MRSPLDAVHAAIVVRVFMDLSRTVLLCTYQQESVPNSTNMPENAEHCAIFHFAKMRSQFNNQGVVEFMYFDFRTPEPADFAMC